VTLDAAAALLLQVVAVHHVTVHPALVETHPVNWLDVVPARVLLALPDVMPVPVAQQGAESASALLALLDAVFAGALRDVMPVPVAQQCAESAPALLALLDVAADVKIPLLTALMTPCINITP